jgi:hypothetical protein
VASSLEKHLLISRSIPYLCYVTWSLPYIGSYMTLYFSVRSRALASLITAVAQVLSTFIMGTFLDWKGLTINQRARYGFLGMMFLSGGIWVWAIVIQHKYQSSKPALDWVDGGFGEGWALYVFQQIEFALTYNFGYWLIGWLAKRPVEVIRYAAVARGVEAAGQCIASGISSTKTPVCIHDVVEAIPDFDLAYCLCGYHPGAVGCGHRSWLLRCPRCRAVTCWRRGLRA